MPASGEAIGRMIMTDMIERSALSGRQDGTASFNTTEESVRAMSRAGEQMFATMADSQREMLAFVSMCLENDCRPF
jgi:hypothetical protein